jgi:uncharacterized SAM-dependent methyltransferase
MAILRNIQIAKKYNVTPATVGNWIEQARNNKINLDLTSVKGKFYLEDTPQNHLELERLKKQGVKFRSKQSSILKVEVSPSLYKIFTEDQIINLFTNISYYNFIPAKFSYTGDGAQFFEEGFIKSLNNPSSKLSVEMDLIESYFEDISERILNDNLLNNKKLNIIELGADNSTHALVKGMKYLNNKNYLNKYISIGISSEMAEIRQKNIQKNMDLKTSKYIFDIEENVLRNILFKEKDNEKYINLCTFLFSGLSNVRNASVLLNNLIDSFSPNDYLLLNTVLTNDAREPKGKSASNQSIIKRHSWLLELLGLTNYITVEYHDYDIDKKIRSSYFVLNRDVELIFKIEGSDHSVFLKRDQRITFFISYRYSVGQLMNLFNNTGFIVDQYNCDRNGMFGMFLLRIDQSKLPNRY